MTGFGLTSGFDCHVYLVDGGDALALVDSGVGGVVSLSEMESNIRSHGFDPEDVETAFITHYHSDHAGGGHLIRDRWGARLAVSSDAVAVLEAGDEEANGLAAAREAGIYPDDTRFHPTPIDDSLSDGDVRRVGSATFEFMATPGHCAGHGSYLLTSGSCSGRGGSCCNRFRTVIYRNRSRQLSGWPQRTSKHSCQDTGPSPSPTAKPTSLWLKRRSTSLGSRRTCCDSSTPSTQVWSHRQIFL